jgi:hypothetical protein
MTTNPAPQDARHVDGAGGGATPWTAGPWSFEYICFGRRIPIKGGKTVFGRPYNVALVNRPGSARSGEDKANAHLIATAPALYDALANLRRVCADIPAIEGNPRFSAANQAALQALSQARGEQP